MIENDRLDCTRRPIVQPTLEQVAEQRLERLAVPHAVDEIFRAAHTRRGKINCELILLRRRRVCEIAATQNRRGRRMVQRRRVHITAILWIEEEVIRVFAHLLRQHIFRNLHVPGARRPQIL